MPLSKRQPNCKLKETRSVLAIMSLFQSDNFIPENLNSLTDEMADVFIYLMNLVNSLKLDNFTEIIKQKIEKNAKKVRNLDI